MEKVAALILAAGQGTRMKSNYPKVLHGLLGKPMVQYVVDTSRNIGSQLIMVVVGFQGEQVIEALGPECQYVWQKEQLGTGHAVMMAQKELENFAGDLLLLYGDTPLLQEETIQKLIALRRQESAAAAILTTHLNSPVGYGRIIRDEQQNIKAIVEDKDANAQEKLVTEVNTGVYCFDCQLLFSVLDQLSPKNAQGEYYLTDVFQIFNKLGLKTVGLATKDAEEVMGPNDRVQLAQTENILKQRINQKWMKAGVTICDPQFTYIGSEVEIGRDTIIYPGTFLLEKTIIGENCVLGPHTRIINSTVGQGTTIQFSQVQSSQLGPENAIGPFAYLRPNTVSEAKVKIGDFVELKNTQIRQGSKIPHLSYVGDTQIGANVNIGAGTITCNYDGVNKAQTVIEDGVFVGSNTNLVAPVTVGENATIAAGSTITADVPPDSLAIARNRQVIKTDWNSPKQKKEK